MNSSNEVRVQLFRFDPGTDALPKYTSHVVPRLPNMRILDVLNHIYDNAVSEDVAYRWFCGTKRCGECGVTVNGIPVLSCWEAAADEMKIEPLANFPIVRDLVVDTDPYERLIMNLQPILKRRSTPKFPEVISHSQMEGVQKLIKCIECNVCTSAMPGPTIEADGMVWKRHFGAAALVRFSRFVLDARDDGDRSALGEMAGLQRFPLFRELDGICPQGIDVINDAVLPARRKLYGNADDARQEGEVPPSFIKTHTWSAFVRLSDPDVRELLRAGWIVHTSIPGIERAYVLPEGSGE